jgi:small subunit ribosomal protein S3
LGHKVHPTGFRLGFIKDWQSKWYSDTHYAEFVREDYKLREEIKAKYPEASISLIEIDRQAKDVTITLHTARPGIVIGRGGQRVEEMRQHLENLIGRRIRLNIQEIRQPELDAYLVARSVADQIVRRVAYRRAMKQAIFRTIQSGAKGIKVSCAGRLGNAEIARRQTSHQGQVPLHTLRADIDYGFTEAHTTLGRIGVKVWIYKGQVLPELPTPEVEAKPAEAAVAETAPVVAEPQAQEKPAGPEAVVAPAVVIEEKPAKVKATEEKPVKAKAAEEKPVKPKATEEKPVKAKATEEKPVKAKAAEEKPAKPKATEEKPVKAKAAEEKPAKAKAAEEKPAKAKATEEKPVKAKAAEEKPAKPKATEEKATGPKAGEEPPAPKRPRKTATATEAEAKTVKPAAETKKEKEPSRKKEKEAKDGAA